MEFALKINMILLDIFLIYSTQILIAEKLNPLHLSLCPIVGRRTVGDDEEEERYNDILLMMELLTNLLSKDFMDFSDPGMYSSLTI